MKIVKYVLPIMLACVGGTSYAFPSNTRFGYTNCTSCHISPTGGGVLTSYGHNSSEEFLSSSSKPFESEATFGALHDYGSIFDDYIRFSADIRYISVRAADKDTPLQGDNFWMQREGEVAVNLTKELVIVGSVGYYALGGNQYQVQTRRDYALVNINQNVSLRVGKFFPAYGIMIEDHTISTRSGLGWDQGQESYNAELALKNSIGEIFLTSIVAGTTPPNSYAFTATKSGAALRMAGYVGSGSQIGVSGLYYQLVTPGGGYQAYFGAFGILGFSRTVYLLSETDGVVSNQAGVQQQIKLLSYNMLGYEVTKGVQLQLAYQLTNKEGEYDFKLQWFPRPHYEIAAMYGQTNTSINLSLLLHYYL
jgi:hypothetical protein